MPFVGESYQSTTMMLVLTKLLVTLTVKAWVLPTQVDWLPQLIGASGGKPHRITLPEAPTNSPTPFINPLLAKTTPFRWLGLLGIVGAEI